MTAIRIIDDHIELASIGVNTHAQIDAHMDATPVGDAQGQMRFWDAGLSRWGHTEVSELIWDDTNKRIGLNENSPACKLHITDGAILAEGVTGGTPSSGAGTRLSWIPAKGILLAGVVTGTQWNDANLGSYSSAFGYDSTISGMASTCFGYNGTASNLFTTHFGNSGVASGSASTHFGDGGEASGQASIHFGRGGIASNHNTVHFGVNGVVSGHTAVHFGGGGEASGSKSIHFGTNGIASGSYSAHFGFSGVASGSYSAHFGENGAAAGSHSIVGGENMQLSSAANYTFAFGYSHSSLPITVPNCFLAFPAIDSGRFAIGTVSPATSAVMDITSTTGALLLPRMTTAQRDALTALNGMLLYNSTLNKFQGYENGAWTNLI